MSMLVVQSVGGSSSSEGGSLFVEGNALSHKEEETDTPKLTFKSASDSNVVFDCTEGDNGDVKITCSVYYV